MSDNFDDFRIDLEKFGVETVDTAVLLIKKIALTIYSKVLLNTPVDNGMLRGAWTIALDQPSDSNIGKKVLAGKKLHAEELQHINGTLASFTSQKLVTIWLSNAMPYVGVVEFGGYPNPPKKGTFVKARKGKTGRRIPNTGKWVIKSQGGFSKQAPQGMLTLALQETVAGLKTLEL